MRPHSTILFGTDSGNRRFALESPLKINRVPVSDPTLYTFSPNFYYTWTRSHPATGVTVTTSVEVLDNPAPGVDGARLEKGLGNDFHWVLPPGMAKSEAQNVFTIEFAMNTSVGNDAVQVTVHFGWAEVQVQFAGQGGFAPRTTAGGQTAANTVAVGQHVEAKFVYDTTFTLNATNFSWSQPSGGSFLKEMATGTAHVPNDYKNDSYFDYGSSPVPD